VVPLLQAKNISRQNVTNDELDQILTELTWPSKPTAVVVTHLIGRDFQLFLLAMSTGSRAMVDLALENECTK